MILQNIKIFLNKYICQQNNKANSSSCFLNKQILFVLVVLIWVTIMFVFTRNNVSPNFWFDESGQFWMAKGLNHYSQPLSADGNFSQLLENNAKFNLDPGGFTIALRYWSMLSSNFVFLRMLPLLFFIIGMVIVSRLSIIWSQKNPLAYFGGFILLSSALLTQYSLELRPYSMEMLATIVALYFCYKIPNILGSHKYALFAGVSLAVLLSSRYSALFSIVSLYILVLSVLVFKTHKKRNLINFSIFTLPMLFSSICIYIFSLRYQNPTGIPPSYVAELMFKTASISSIVFNLRVFYTLLPFLVLSIILLVSSVNKNIKDITRQYYLYFIYSLILNIIFIVLSILGRYPWGINSRWDISTHAIFMIGWLPLVFIAGDFLREKNGFLNKLYEPVVLIVFLVLSFNNALNFHYNLLDSTYENYSANKISSDSKILINVGAYPTVRYLFEYGPLKNEKNNKLYMNIALFNYAGYTHKDAISDFSNIDQYDYIILTHFDYDNSEIKKIIIQKSNWINSSVKGPARIFKNVMMR